MNQQHTSTSKWTERELFQVVVALSLLVFGGFVVFDGRRFYARYVNRCENDPAQAECAFFKSTKVTPKPELGIVMHEEGGKWAIQLDSPNEKTANDLSMRLLSAGASPRVIKIQQPRMVTYVVQLGRFRTRKNALSAAAQLKGKNLIQGFKVVDYRSH